MYASGPVGAERCSLRAPIWLGWPEPPSDPQRFDEPSVVIVCCRATRQTGVEPQPGLVEVVLTTDPETPGNDGTNGTPVDGSRMVDQLAAGLVAGRPASHPPTVGLPDEAQCVLDETPLG